MSDELLPGPALHSFEWALDQIDTIAGGLELQDLDALRHTLACFRDADRTAVAEKPKPEPSEPLPTGWKWWMSQWSGEWVPYHAWSAMNTQSAGQAWRLEATGQMGPHGDSSMVNLAPDGPQTPMQRLLSATFDEGEPVAEVRLADVKALEDGTLVAVPRMPARVGEDAPVTRPIARWEITCCYQCGFEFVPWRTQDKAPEPPYLCSEACGEAYDPADTVQGGS